MTSPYFAADETSSTEKWDEESAVSRSSRLHPQSGSTTPAGSSQELGGWCLTAEPSSVRHIAPGQSDVSRAEADLNTTLLVSCPADHACISTAIFAPGCILVRRRSVKCDNVGASWPGTKIPRRNSKRANRTGH